MIKYILSLIAIVVLSSVGMVFGMGHSPNPPNINTYLPLNVSDVTQTKEGHLTVERMYVAGGDVRVGSQPSGGWSGEKLDVNGNIKIRGSSNGIIFDDGSKIKNAPHCTTKPRLGWNGSNWTCNDLYNP